MFREGFSDFTIEQNRAKRMFECMCVSARAHAEEMVYIRSTSFHF